MTDATTDDERPLVAHLLELRSRLLRGAAGLVLVLVCLLPFANTLYALLAQPLLDKLPKGGQLIATQVASPFFAPMKLAFFAALMIAMPWLLYQAWAFVAPGLYRREKGRGEDRRSIAGLWAKRRYREDGRTVRETSLLFGLLRWRVTSGEGFDMLPPALPGPGWPEQEEPSEAVESRTFF